MARIKSTYESKIERATAKLRALPDAALSSDVVSLKDACAFLKIGRTRLYQLRKGPLPWVQRGGRKFIPRVALEAYAAAGLVRRDLAS